MGLRFSTPGSPTRADFQITPTLMTSEHRPASVTYDGDEFHWGLSVGLQNATSAGEITLASADPHEQPRLDYQLFSGPMTGNECGRLSGLRCASPSTRP